MLCGSIGSRLDEISLAAVTRRGRGEIQDDESLCPSSRLTLG